MLKEIDKKVLLLSPQYQKHKSYWLEVLAGISGTSLQAGQSEESGSGMQKLETPLPSHLYTRLLAMCKNSDISIYITLLAALKLLLFRYTGNKDICVASPINPTKSSSSTLNDYVYIRTAAEGEMTVKDLLLAVRRAVLDAYEHQDYPVSAIKEHIIIENNIGCRLDTLHDIFLHRLEESGVELEFSFKLDRRSQSMTSTIYYSGQVFSSPFIQRLSGHLTRLLDHAVHHIDARLNAIPYMDEKETQRLLETFNRTAANYPGDKTVIQLFQEQAARFPQRTALALGHSHISYAELHKRVIRLASVLAAKGAGPGTIVALFMERSLDLIIAMLAVLKAGSAYLPIDPDHPRKRVDFFLRDANPVLVLTSSALASSHSYLFTSVLQARSANVILTARRPQIKEFDGHPIPDRSLVNYEKYTGYIGLTPCKNSLSLQATRGCPYKCAYCHKIWPKSHIIRSAQSIFEEVKLYYDMGVRRFAFVDDIFNLNVKNSRTFFKMILDNGMKIQFFFPAGLRGDILTREYIDLMVEAGMVNAGLALETASPRLQKLIWKNLKLDKLKENLHYLCQTYPHVITELFMMHGFPGETEKEAMMTLNFLKDLKWIHFPYLHILKIYPGTDMEQIALENGISRTAIVNSADLAYHQLPETLPFDSNFTVRYQSDFLNEYFLNKERLLHVLPQQMKLLTRDELLQKYDSYLPVDIKSFDQLLDALDIKAGELGEVKFLEEEHFQVPDLHAWMKSHFPAHSARPDALRVLLLDLSLFYRDQSDMLYDVVEAPLGLMYLLTCLNKELGDRVNGKIAKSRIDFKNDEELKRLLEDFQPHVIGVRTLSFYKDFFHRTIASIRHWGADVPVIAGGPYATSDYTAILQDPNIDLVVMGEGELTFNHLMTKVLENNYSLPNEDILKSIPGLAYVPGHNRNVNRPGCPHVLMTDLLTETNGTAIAGESLEKNQSPGDPAYIIYTSGTTGVPKGVMVSHRNVVRLMTNDRFQFDFNENDVWTMFHAPNFDFSVWEMYGALLYGGKLIVVPKLAAADTDGFLNSLVKQSVTVLNQTPSSFYNLSAREMERTLANLNIRYIIFGGEALSPAKLAPWRNRYPDTRLINMFGITETTVHVTYKEIKETEIALGKSNIGGPIPTLQTYIMNGNLQLLPQGLTGELCVGGDGVASGYLNRPELSHEKFKPHPFIPGQRLYLSGDLGRLEENGDLEYIGRKDHQVKIRGFRIELGEIEARLSRHPQIKDALVVSSGTDSDGQNACLSAYYVSDNRLESAELREFLSLELPEYTIPAYFTRIDAIPLTTNGKLDRSALPDPSIGGDKDRLEPKDQIEHTLVDVWAGVLDLEPSQISIDANFFELGGHSLKTTTLISRISQNLGVKVPFITIFETPTIQGLADYIRSAKKETFDPILPVEDREYYPASPAQRRLYIAQRMNPDNTAYNVVQTIIMTSAPDTGRLQQAFHRMIQRHESLRTSFHMIADQVVQRVHSQVDFSISTSDPLGKNDPVNSNARPFNLATAPLLRVSLHQQAGDRYVLMVDMHHIITDAVSMGIFITEIIALYQGKSLSAVTLQYRDYASYWRDMIDNGKIKDMENFWLREFTGDIPLLNLPLDFPRPKSAAAIYESQTVNFTLDGGVTNALREMALKTNSTLFMVLLAIFNVFLAKQSGQQDIVVGTPSAGRGRAGLEKVLGFFVNMMALRNYPDEDKTFYHFLEELTRHTLRAFENQDYPFDMLVDKIAGKRPAGRHPLFDVLFWLQTLDFETNGNSPDEDNPQELFQQTPAKFDLMLYCMETGDSLSFGLEYNTRLFLPQHVRAMSHDFTAMAQSLSENPHQLIADISSASISGSQTGSAEYEEVEFNI